MKGKGRKYFRWLYILKVNIMNKVNQFETVLPFITTDSREAIFFFPSNTNLKQRNRTGYGAASSGCPVGIIKRVEEWISIF